MGNIEKSLFAKDANVDGYLFASEKPKIQSDVDLDANLYTELEKFLNELTGPKQRVCIGLMAKDPLVMFKMKRHLTGSVEGDRIGPSLSAVFNARIGIGKSQADLLGIDK
jgi:hypothetical protein